jgi:hypothetical protein
VTDNNYSGFDINEGQPSRRPLPRPVEPTEPPAAKSSGKSLVFWLVVGALLFLVAWPVALVIAVLWGIGYLLLSGLDK